MKGETVLEILKWIGLAFAAGFLGYFGKHLGRMFINKFRKPGNQPEQKPPAKEELNYKLEKKKLKLEKKRLKKGNEKK